VLDMAQPTVDLLKAGAELPSLAASLTGTALSEGMLRRMVFPLRGPSVPYNSGITHGCCVIPWREGGAARRGIRMGDRD